MVGEEKITPYWNTIGHIDSLMEVGRGWYENGRFDLADGFYHHAQSLLTIVTERHPGYESENVKKRAEAVRGAREMVRIKYSETGPATISINPFNFIGVSNRSSEFCSDK